MKDKLRVLFLEDFFSFLGGTEYNNYLLLTGLRRRGHEILVCVGEKPSFPAWADRIRAQGIPFYSSDRPYSDAPGIEPELAYIHNQAGEWIRQWKPDVIFSHPPGKLLIAYLECFPRSRIPVVAMEYTVPGESTKRWYQPNLPDYMDRITAFIAKCGAAERGLRSYFGYNGPVFRIPNLVAGGPEREPAVQGELLSVGCVARLSPEKGIGFLLGAWRMVAEAIPEAALHIYGHGLHEAYYRSLAEFLEIRDRVIFEGTFPPVDGIAGIAKRHRVFVQPSLFESIPNSMIELMLWKKAFVASNVGGIPELLNPERGEGILVRPGSTEGLAEALLTLLKDEELTNQIAETSYRAVKKNYDYETILQAYEAVLLDAVKRSGEAGQ
ncbi:MAG: glycosyltransferase family 4 protein [Oscillibacter sp.]|nr:glycosyltransferase family 4 protein [Oscillibacter sp.]